MIYFLAISLLWFYQEKVIFYPTKLSPNYKFLQFVNANEVFLPISETVCLHALHFKVQEPKGLILYFHGNSQGLEYWGYAAETFSELGYDVFMPDYRGYGKSSGKPDKGVLHDDADTVFSYISQEYPSESIVIYGRSLGSGIACSLATRHSSKLLILETPYLSILSLAQSQRPYLPVRWLLKYPMRSDLNISNIQCPVHLFHGTNDELIPYQQAVDLAKAYGDTSILTTLQGGMHGNLEDFDLFHQKLEELLA